MKLGHLLAAVLCWSILIDKPIRVIDGDTFTATFAIWHDMTITERVRVLEIDTPEMHGDDRERAEAAKVFTAVWLEKGPFVVTTCQRDAFGRVLGTVDRQDEKLSDELKKAGLEKKRKGE